MRRLPDRWLMAGCLVSALAMASPAQAVDAQRSAPKAARKAAKRTATAGPVASVESAAPDAAPRPLDLGPSVFRSAIEAADADWAPSTGRADTFGTSPLSSQATVDRSFKAAEIERCGGPGTLKFDPLPVWGDFVMGVFALPYAIKAIATGHCKL